MYNDLRNAKALLLAGGLRASSLIAHDSEQRMTPLMWACVHGNADLVRALLAAISATSE